MVILMPEASFATPARVMACPAFPVMVFLVLIAVTPAIQQLFPVGLAVMGESAGQKCAMEILKQIVSGFNPPRVVTAIV